MVKNKEVRKCKKVMLGNFLEILVSSYCTDLSNFLFTWIMMSDYVAF